MSAKKFAMPRTRTKRKAVEPGVEPRRPDVFTTNSRCEVALLHLRTMRSFRLPPKFAAAKIDGVKAKIIFAATIAAASLTLQAQPTPEPRGDKTLITNANQDHVMGA